jgi:hypothetical protein
MSNLIAAARARGVAVPGLEVVVRRLPGQRPSALRRNRAGGPRQPSDEGGMAKLIRIAERGCIVRNTPALPLTGRRAPA